MSATDAASRRRKWQSTPVLLPRESRGQRSLGRLLSMGSHRVGHDWSDSAVAAAAQQLRDLAQGILWDCSQMVARPEVILTAPSLTSLVPELERLEGWTDEDWEIFGISLYIQVGCPGGFSSMAASRRPDSFQIGSRFQRCVFQERTRQTLCCYYNLD